jgi:Flp pilus assembly protein TadD
MTNSKNGKTKNRRKKFIIIGLAVLLIALLAVGGWVYLQRNKTAADAHHDESEHASTTATIVTKARQFIDQKDVKAGVSYYDSQINEAHDDETRKQLRIAKVDYLLQAQDNAQAVTVAKEVVTTYSDDSLAYAALARAYEANSQRAEALVQYRLALAELEPNQPVSRANPRVIYEAKIKELES